MAIQEAKRDPAVRRAGGAVRWVVLGALGVLAVVAVALASRFGVDPGVTASPLIGEPQPELALPRLDGAGELDLASLRGQVVVMNFFASWCLQCIEEHAALVATADAYRDRGVQFVAVVFQDRQEAAQAFLEELGASETTEYVMDPASRAAIAHGVFGVPETFFVDPAGTVVGRIVGASDSIVLGQTIEAILAGERPGEQVLGETQSGPGG
jgi:cytochrome c biogenesis protein CcmG/thiol:disulfide interchange protein DsbE